MQNSLLRWSNWPNYGREFRMEPIWYHFILCSVWLWFHSLSVQEEGVTNRRLHDCVWKDPRIKISLDEMLNKFARNEHWPAGDRKPGHRSTSNQLRKKNEYLHIGLMLHAPVIACIDDRWQIQNYSNAPLFHLVDCGMMSLDSIQSNISVIPTWKMRTKQEFGHDRD